MKTRNGFVSNSSSSSFVVRRADFFKSTTSKVFTTSNQDKALEKFGFRKTTSYSPSQVPAFYDKKAWEKESKELKSEHWDNVFNYGYEVTCNQDEVIQFLISQKISFVAECHYGHESVIYNANTDKVYLANNFGSILEMYGDSLSDTEIQSYNKRQPIVVMTGAEWLKKNRY